MPSPRGRPASAKSRPLQGPPKCPGWGSLICGRGKAAEATQPGTTRRHTINTVLPTLRLKSGNDEEDAL